MVGAHENHDLAYPTQSNHHLAARIPRTSERSCSNSDDTSARRLIDGRALDTTKNHKSSMRTKTKYCHVLNQQLDKSYEDSLPNQLKPIGCWMKKHLDYPPQHRPHCGLMLSGHLLILHVPQAKDRIAVYLPGLKLQRDEFLY